MRRGGGGGEGGWAEACNERVYLYILKNKSIAKCVSINHFVFVDMETERGNTSPETKMGVVNIIIQTSNEKKIWS